MKKIYIALGTPGVGKSTFFKKAGLKLFGNTTRSFNIEHYIISPDKIRLMHQAPKVQANGILNITNVSDSKVWDIINNLLEIKTNRGELIIVDATHSRTKNISVYKKYADLGYRIVAVDFREYATLDQIKHRNQNRESYKIVPESSIETVYERLQTLDIPTWVKVIKPEDFIDDFTSIKMNFDEFDTLSFIGDIHGCADELQMIQDDFAFDGQPKVTKDAIIFVGDYFDRGPKVVETFKRLMSLKKDYWVLFLKGNHEEPLMHYKEFMREMLLHLQNNVNHTYQKQIYIIKLSEKIQKNTIKYLSKIGDSGKWYDPIIRLKNSLFGESIITSFLKNILDSQIKDLGDNTPLSQKDIEILEKIPESYKKLDAWIELMQTSPVLDQWLIDTVHTFKAPSYLIKDPDTGFDKLKKTSLTTCKQFLLSDIEYLQISSFVKSLGQLFYGDFHGKTIVATHGGISDLPSLITPTSDLIRGVGSYNDAQLVDDTFHRLNPLVISIHGHRNLTNIPIQSTPGTFNINGDVDLGLRAVRFNKDQTYEMVEITPRSDTLAYYKEKQFEKSGRFKQTLLTDTEQQDALLEMYTSKKGIVVKELPHNTAAINFSDKVFEFAQWDSLMVKARGLFVTHIPIQQQEDGVAPDLKILARGYDKFFNLGERSGFESRDIRDMAYPLKIYEKANGYLGILSVDIRDSKNPVWFTASKSTPLGEYADNFRKMIEPKLTPALQTALKSLNCTLLLEVIEPVFDPHIETYSAPELVLLGAIKNDLNFKPESDATLGDIITLFKESDIKIRLKKLIAVCNTYNDYYIIKKRVNEHPLFSDDGIEGYVIEDSSEIPNMFKIKTRWYSFWKCHRGTYSRLLKNVRNSIEKEEGPIINKSSMIRFKERLYSAEDIKIFNFMVDKIQGDFEIYKNKNIIEIRQEYLSTL